MPAALFIPWTDWQTDRWQRETRYQTDRDQLSPCTVRAKLCSGLFLSLSHSLSHDHTTYPMKPMVSPCQCPQHVNYHSARHITFGFMFPCSFPGGPVCPAFSSSPLSLFPSASVFPLPLLRARSCLDLALPLSFSFPQGVCVRVQSAVVWHHSRISSTALPFRLLSFPINHYFNMLNFFFQKLLSHTTQPYIVLIFLCVFVSL